MKKMNRVLVALLSVAALSTAAHAADTQTFGNQDTQKVTKKADRKADRKGSHKHKGDCKQGHKGGFYDPARPVDKVADAANWKDDQKIVLEGNIIKQVSKDVYVFKDASGEHNVEIDRKAWGPHAVQPADTVRLIAEVDKDASKLEIEVKRVLKKPVDDKASQQ